MSTSDSLGGAERIAAQLHDEYLQRGNTSMLAVGRQKGAGAGVFTIRHDLNGPLSNRIFWKIHHAIQPFYGRALGAKFIARQSHSFAEPARRRDRANGREDFHYPGTRHLLNSASCKPEILHLHNLHGDYFDLRALPALSRSQPTILNLHDAWLMSGHCAHSLGCDKWMTGCGQCPDLSLYPAIRRDDTGANWRIKRGIFEHCAVHVTAPSKWLMDKALQSLMAPGIAGHRVIPNGVNTRIFRPNDKAKVRELLGLPHDVHILLFSSYNATRNSWKDYATIQSAIDELRKSPLPRPMMLVVLGDSRPNGSSDHNDIRFVPFEADLRRVAAWYSAADLYVHAARADTFPNSVLEALACGTPVVATAVGGISEQIRSLDWFGQNNAESEHPTGVLTPPADHTIMARAIKKLLADDTLRRQLAINSIRDVESRFTLTRQADEFLKWYSELIELRLRPHQVSDSLRRGHNLPQLVESAI